MPLIASDNLLKFMDYFTVFEIFLRRVKLEVNKNTTDQISGQIIP